MTPQKSALALAVILVSGIAAIVAIVCVIGMVSGLKTDLFHFVPIFADIDEAWLVALLGIACVIVMACQRMVRKLLGADSIRELLPPL